MLIHRFLCFVYGHTHLYIYIYIYIYRCTHIYIHIVSAYTYIYIERDVALSHLLPCPECALLSQTMSAVPHNKHRLLCRTADMSALSCGRHVCCATQQESLLRHTTYASCTTQQTCLLCDTAEMSTV